MGKRILVFLVILSGGLVSKIHAQTTAELTVDGDTGPITVCSGASIEILATIDPPSATIAYQWVKETPLYTDLTAQSGTGDTFSSIRVQVTESSVFLVRVPGGGEDRITVNVEDPPNPGLSTTVFLCNKTGTLDLFGELGGTPVSGGDWTDSSGSPFANGMFVVGTNVADIYTYTVTPPAGSECGPVNASVTVKDCSNDDYDNDGVKNGPDLDDDNDGILDTVEEGCVTKVPTNFSIKENFGFGTVPSQNPYVVPDLVFSSTFPDDTAGNGAYTVANSTHFLTPIAVFDATFVATDLIGNVDADGNTEGRYLAINMLTSAFDNKPVYLQQDLPVTPGIEHTFSLSISSTNNNAGEVRPSLAIQLLRADGSVIDEEVTGEIANGTDQWNTILKTFTPIASDEFVTLQVINLQTNIGNGNDFAIDNIYLYTKQCDFDLDGIPDSRDLDSDNDGIYDVVEAGGIDANNDGRADGAENSDGIPSSAGAGLIPVATTTGTNDYLNLDSDGDGCSDTNEAYFDPEADGGDTGVYGPDSFDYTTIVDLNGLVIAATYTPVADQDGNTIADYTEIGPDTNANTIPDACEVVTREYICSSVTTFDLNTLLLPAIPRTGAWAPGPPTGLIDPSGITPFDTDTAYTYTYVESSVTKTVSVLINISETPALSLGTATCALDKLTFDQLFKTSSPLWTITLNPPTAGTLTTTGVTGVASNTSFEIIATNPTNTDCFTTIVVPARDCSCPDLEEPSAPNNPTICGGDAIPALTVTIPTGLIGRWYFDDQITPIPGQDNTDTYTPTASDLVDGVNEFYVEGYSTIEGCPSDQILVTLTQSQSPVIVPPVENTGCDAYVLEALSIGEYYTATGGPTGTGTLLAPGTSLTTSDSVFIYAETTTNGVSCSTEEPFTYTVLASPTPTAPVVGVQCDSYQLPALGAGQQYFLGSSSSGEELFAGDTITASQTIILVETNAANCSGETSFDVTIQELVVPDLGPDQFICVAPDGTLINNEPALIVSGLDSATYTFEWLFNGAILPSENGPSLSASLPGTYSLNATSLAGCASSSAAVDVLGVTGPETLTLVNSGDLITNNSITATATGTGTFEYSLDQGSYQSSPVFNDVALGFHEVSVRDVYGCSILTDELFVIGFPNFFTPNEDGYNDNWNVITDESIPNMTISIFDRYGKLLKTITSIGNGWDGKFNGQDLPATDYWFLATLENQEEYRSHFALIR